MSWKGLPAFLRIKYHNPENLIFQHIPLWGKGIKPYKKSRLEEINGSRNGVIIDTLNSIGIVEIVKCGVVILTIFEGFFCHGMQYLPSFRIESFMNVMVAKRDGYKKKV